MYSYWYGGVLIFSIIVDGVHQTYIPPWKRQEHAEDNPVQMASPWQATSNIGTPAGSGSIGGGVVFGSSATVNHYRGMA